MHQWKYLYTSRHCTSLLACCCPAVARSLRHVADHKRTALEFGLQDSEALEALVPGRVHSLMRCAAEGFLIPGNLVYMVCLGICLVLAIPRLLLLVLGTLTPISTLTILKFSTSPLPSICP